MSWLSGNSKRLPRAANDLTSRMRKKLVLQSPVNTPDGGGGYTRSYSDIATVWAEMEALAGKEEVKAMQLAGVVTHRFTLRYRSGVTTAMRLKMGSRLFNIRAVINPGERNERLEILVEEGGVA